MHGNPAITNKTDFVHILYTCTGTLHNEAIHEVTHSKLLGVTMDS